MKALVGRNYYCPHIAHFAFLTILAVRATDTSSAMRPEPLAPLPTMAISEDLEVLSVSEVNSAGSRSFAVRQSVYSQHGLRSEPDEFNLLDSPPEEYHRTSPHEGRHRESSLSDHRSNSGSQGGTLRQNTSSRQGLRSEQDQEPFESPVEAYPATTPSPHPGRYRDSSFSEVRSPSTSRSFPISQSVLTHHGLRSEPDENPMQEEYESHPQHHHQQRRQQRERTYEPPAQIHIPFNTLEKHTQAILYYKGDILSVLLNLAKLFHPHSLRTLYSSAVLQENPHLPSLLIRHAECAITLKMLDPHLFTSLGFNFDELFHLLGSLGESVTAGHDIRARAKALRVLRTFGWNSGVVQTIWAKNDNEAESPITLQLKLVQEISDAKLLNERYNNGEDTFVLFVLCLVKRGIVRNFEEDYNQAMELQKSGIRQDDLLSTFVWFNLALRTAVDRNNAAVVRSMIRTIAEMKKIGEWGMLIANWWKTQEPAFLKVPLYQKEYEKLYGYQGIGIPDLFPKT